MNTYEIIKELAKEKKISIRQLEIDLGFSNGYFSKWKKVSPNSEGLQKVADYFNVSVDYLLGRTEKKHYYDLTEKDHRSIEKELERMIEDLTTTGPIAFSKEDGEMSDETYQALLISLKNSLEIARIEAKKKYTPKKYRN